MRWSKQMNRMSGTSVVPAGKPNCPKILTRHGYGASPICDLFQTGRTFLLIGQKSGMVYGIDPDKRGEILWETQIGKGGALGGVMWGMAADSTNVYVPLFRHHAGASGGLFA